jgi:hypothetical protein
MLQFVDDASIARDRGVSFMEGLFHCELEFTVQPESLFIVVPGLESSLNNSGRHFRLTRKSASLKSEELHSLPQPESKACEA